MLRLLARPPCFAVIIDNFAEQTQAEELPVSPHHIRQFVEVGITHRHLAWTHGIDAVISQQLV